MKPNRPLRNRRVLRNALVSCAVAALLAAGSGSREAFALAHVGLTPHDGSHRPPGIGDAGDRQARHAVREKLFASKGLPSSRTGSPAAGGSGIFESQPFGRFYTDIVAMGNHVANDFRSAGRNWGGVMMGLESQDTLL